MLKITVKIDGVASELYEKKHLFVPMELSTAKFFRGNRGKYKKLGRKARMDSLTKTLEFVNQW